LNYCIQAVGERLIDKKEDDDMGLFNFTSKDKAGNRRVRFAYSDGLDGVFGNGAVLDLTIDNEENKLIIQSPIGSKKQVILQLSKITDVRTMTDKEIEESSKSVVGRAALGGLLLGPLGAVIGGMSGVGNKQKSVTRSFVIISYQSSGEDKKLAFEIVGASIGWNKFIEDLNPKKSNAYEPIDL